MMMYAQDYDERTAPTRTTNKESAGYCQSDNSQYPPMEGWRTALLPYFKSYQLMLCPSNPYREHATEEVNKQFKVSYATNGVIEYYLDPRDNVGVPLAGLKRPAETVMLLESNWPCNNQGDWSAWKSAGSCDPGINGANQAFFTHRGKGGSMNWAFFDGHSKAYKLPATLARIGPRGVAGTYNLWGLEEDGDFESSSHWGWSWWMDQDQSDNLCDVYK